MRTQRWRGPGGGQEEEEESASSANTQQDGQAPQGEQQEEAQNPWSRPPASPNAPPRSMFQMRGPSGSQAASQPCGASQEAQPPWAAQFQEMQAQMQAQMAQLAQFTTLVPVLTTICTERQLQEASRQ